MELKEFKKLKTEEMPGKIKMLSSQLSVVKNMPLFAGYLKVFLLANFAFLDLYNEPDTSPPKYREKLLAFQEVLEFMQDKKIYLYDIEASSNYKYEREKQKLPFTTSILTIYSKYTAQYHTAYSQPITQILETLKDMDDTLKPETLHFFLDGLVSQDRKQNRELDPVFEKMLELYGFSIITAKPMRRNQWTQEQPALLEQVLKRNATKYLEAIEMAAQKEDKISMYQNYLKKALAHVSTEKNNNVLIEKTAEILDISKEQKILHQTLKVYNKKNVKKQAKEKKQLTTLQDLLEAPKKTKFKL